MGATADPSGYEILRGGLHFGGRPVDVPRGLLYVQLARAGWKGEDGPLSLDFVRRLRLLDPRMSLFYLRPDREAAA